MKVEKGIFKMRKENRRKQGDPIDKCSTIFDINTLNCDNKPIIASIDYSTT